MRAFVFALLAAQLLGVSYAQDPMSRCAAEPAAVVDLLHSAGMPETFFEAKFDSCRVAALHYGPNYDLTYSIEGMGLLTVLFFEGRAGSFRLITSDARATAEELPRMLGIDTGQLQLVKELDVMKIWKGTLGEFTLEEVSAIIGPSGWNTAVIKISGYQHP